MNSTLKVCIATCLSLALASCGDDPTSSGQTGTLILSLTDAPGDFDAVRVTFSEISANIDGEWMTVTGDPQTIDLLEWNNGRSIELGRAELPAGQYSQIRLIIDDAEVEIDGVSHAMTVPSGAQTGLKLGPAFTIEPNLTFSLVVDFDAARSVIPLGPRQSLTGYNLRPQVRMVPQATSGAISGTVSNPLNGPIAYAIAAGDTITSSIIDSTGGFTLAFLPEGSYDVAIADTMSAVSTQSGVAVETGNTTQLGELILQ